MAGEACANRKEGTRKKAKIKFFIVLSGVT
jgi:hypothetical protein